MTRQLIDIGPLWVNTFWGGKEKGECVQFTMNKDYIHMTRLEAVKFCYKLLGLLINQMIDDTITPPWWQVVAQNNDKR